jgi:hypothetical protein
MSNRVALTHLRVLVWMLCVPLFVFSAAVAATGGQESPLNVQPVLVVACMFFSTLAGAFTLSLRMIAELKGNFDAGTPEKPLFAPYWTGLSHMFGSWLAGAVLHARHGVAAGRVAAHGPGHGRIGGRRQGARGAGGQLAAASARREGLMPWP